MAEEYRTKDQWDQLRTVLCSDVTRGPEQTLTEIMDLAGAYAVAYADYSQRDASPRDLDSAAPEVERTRTALEHRLRQALTDR